MSPSKSMESPASDKMLEKTAMVAAIIPCFRCKDQIKDVLINLPHWFHRAYVIDDCCPQETGKYVQSLEPFLKSQGKTFQLIVLKNEKNLGVGGATIAGYRAAYNDGCSVLVKIDGDGQMDPNLSWDFILPLLEQNIDYTKGNRFFDPKFLTQMPWIRLFGNAVLSFISKIATGYWQIMDPHNGYTALHRRIVPFIDFDKLDRRYFFEPDMLFRLYLARAVVKDIPMAALYANEKSNLSVTKVLWDFPGRYLSRFFKRIVYTYFVRDFNLASLQIIVGLPSLAFGTLFGAHHWYHSIQSGIPATAGTVALATLPIFLGVQLLLAAALYDCNNYPLQQIRR